MRGHEAWSSAIGLIVMVAGCGPSRPATVPVRGVLQFTDGTPVRGGRIEFESLSGGINARGISNDQGEFTLSTFREGDGAVVGRHRVIVQQDLSPYSGLTGKFPHGTHVRPPTKIPVRYGDYRTSPLIAEVKRSDDLLLRLELSSDDRRDAPK